MWGGLGNCFCCFEGVFEVKRGELVFLDVRDCQNFFQKLMFLKKVFHLWDLKKMIYLEIFQTLKW